MALNPLPATRALVHDIILSMLLTTQNLVRLWRDAARRPIKSPDDEAEMPLTWLRGWFLLTLFLKILVAPYELL